MDIRAQMIGLMIFVAVVVGDVVGIVLDIWLRADGRPTITETVCADPMWIVPLIGAHMAQALGLLVPNACQCTNRSLLSRASRRKNREARVLWNLKRLYFRVIQLFSF